MNDLVFAGEGPIDSRLRRSAGGAAAPPTPPAGPLPLAVLISRFGVWFSFSVQGSVATLRFSFILFQLYFRPVFSVR